MFDPQSAQDAYFLESNFDLPFSSWKAGIGLKNTNLDDLARSSFLHSAGATILVLVFLLCGIALTIRATDQEARLAQAKSNFVANVSHELKTPLSLLSLFSEILELGRVNNEEKKTEYYRIIRHESRRLNKMIDNILDFSKIEAGRKTYAFADGDMVEVIENVLSSYRYQIMNSGFNIQTNIQASLPSVLIDRDAMAQAISNLVDNAIKYSGEVKQLSITTKTVRSDLFSSFAAAFGVLLLAGLLFMIFVMGSWLPASAGAPQVGQKAPDFTLTDSNNKPVTLAQLLSEPINNKPPKGVLLIFYRGYW
ncbi:MAG: histidine kinase dimerization/phospho-acceptor domain-containing protein [Pyrinomonadaceae bacterium]